MTNDIIREREISAPHRLTDGDYVVLDWLSDFTVENEGSIPVLYQVNAGKLEERFNAYDVTSGHPPVMYPFKHLFTQMHDRQIGIVYSPWDAPVDRILGREMGWDNESGWGAFEGYYDGKDGYWVDRFGEMGIELRLCDD